MVHCSKRSRLGDGKLEKKISISHKADQLKHNLQKRQSKSKYYIVDVAKLRREASNTASRDTDNNLDIDGDGGDYVGELRDDEDVLVLKATVCAATHLLAIEEYFIYMDIDDLK